MNNIDILLECNNNSELSYRVYLEMLRTRPDVDIQYEEFLNICEGLLDHRLNNERKKDKYRSEKLDMHLENNRKRDKYKSEKTRNKDSYNREKRIDDVNNTEDVKDIKMNRQLQRDDKLAERRKREIDKKIKTAKETAKSTGEFVGKHKKAIGGAIIGAAVIKSASDYSNYKHWQSMKPEKRKNISFNQWKSIGKPKF